MDEITKNIWNIAITACITVMAFFFKRTIDNIDAAHEGIVSVDKRLSAHELEVEKFKTHVGHIYAKDANIQQSLSRVHERMDDIHSDLSADIKKILLLIGGRGK